MQKFKTTDLMDPAFLCWMQYVVFGSTILYFGRSLFIPFSFAVLVSFVLYPICRWLESKGIARLAAIVISLILLMILGLFVSALLVSQFVSFLHEWPTLHVKLLET